jgi:hypothetical protein
VCRRSRRCVLGRLLKQFPGPLIRAVTAAIQPYLRDSDTLVALVGCSSSCSGSKRMQGPFSHAGNTITRPLLLPYFTPACQRQHAVGSIDSQLSRP